MPNEIIRQVRPFNRHFRFDCDNPKFKQEDEFLTFEIIVASLPMT